MSSAQRGVSTRILLTILWLVASAGIAYLVARNVTPTATSSGGDLNVPPVAIEERATVALETRTVQPVLSAEGRVAQDGSRWLLEATILPESLAYQLLDSPVGVKALITGGPAGFDCAWEGLLQSPETGGMAMRCQIPSDIKVVAGLPGTMVVQLMEATEVQALPVSAVIGTSETGQVIVIESDNQTSVRQVEIGLSDVFHIEITGGLEPGETVFENPVQSDFIGVQS
ncbi:MAG: hypothetical protein H0T93_06890 [Chloroflexia bacterium]|nr:hypothetical protein [Chloroflexia bacterium]